MFLCIMSHTILWSGAVFVLVETPWLATEKLILGSLQQMLSRKDIKEAMASSKSQPGQIRKQEANQPPNQPCSHAANQPSDQPAIRRGGSKRLQIIQDLWNCKETSKNICEKTTLQGKSVYVVFLVTVFSLPGVASQASMSSARRTAHEHLGGEARFCEPWNRTCSN